MDPQYKGTVVEVLLPLIATDAEAHLKRHRITKEHYLLWLYRNTSNTTGLHAALVIGLCLSLFGAIVLASLEQAGRVHINEQLIGITVGTLTLLATVFCLTAWTMRHRSQLLEQHLQTIGFVHKTSSDYLRGLSPRAWRRIARFSPDIDRFRRHHAVAQQPPAITWAQQRTLDALTPIRKLTGWLAFTACALLFFLGATGMSLTTAGVLLLIGTWCTLRSLQILIAGQFDDIGVGMTVVGAPAKMIGAFGVALGLGVFVVGIAGLFLTLPR